MTRPEQRIREIYQAECFRRRNGLDFEIYDDIEGGFPDLRVR